MNVKVIINPAAGREEAVLFKMNAFFREHNIDYHVSVTTPKLSATEATQDALSKGFDAVVGYGGDGTLMEIANALCDSETPLLIVPGGTSNTLSQELHIPPSIPKALSLLLPEYGRPQKVDMAQFGDRYYLTALGVGIPAQWALEADRDLKNKYGLLAYIVTGVRATIKAKPALYHLTLDGKTVQTQGMACMISNIGSSGFRGLRLGKAISNTDGILDVLVFKLKLFESAPDTTEAMLRSMRKNRRLFFEHYRAKEIVLSAEPPQFAMVDGEPIGSTPLHITVAPHSLAIYSPTERTRTLWDKIVTSLVDDEF